MSTYRLVPLGITIPDTTQNATIVVSVPLVAGDVIVNALAVTALGDIALWQEELPRFTTTTPIIETGVLPGDHNGSFLEYNWVASSAGSNVTLQLLLLVSHG